MFTMLLMLIVVAVILAACVPRRAGRVVRAAGVACWNLAVIACFVVAVVAFCSLARPRVTVSSHPAWKEIQHVRGAAAPVAALARQWASGHSIVMLSDHDGAPPPAEQAEVVEPPPAAAEAPDPTVPSPPSDPPPAPPQDSMPAAVEREEEEDTAAGDGGERASGERLSVELLAHAQIDFAARPAWVDRVPEEVGEVLQVSVCSGPFLRLAAARKELYDELKRATDEHIDHWLGHAGAAQWIDWNRERIRKALVAPENYFDEQVISPSFGVMHQSHAMLEFGPAFHQEVEQQWHDVVARAQLVKLTLIAAAILGVLTLLFGYFHADTATRGFYAGRLKIATVVAILGWVALGIVLARSIPWLHI